MPDPDLDRDGVTVSVDGGPEVPVPPYEPRTATFHASIGCPICGSYGHLAEDHTTRPAATGPMVGGWTKSTGALLDALGKLKLEVSRAQDAVQVGKPIGSKVALAAAAVEALDLKVTLERASRSSD